MIQIFENFHILAQKINYTKKLKKKKKKKKKKTGQILKLFKANF